jgi:protein phosphatase
MKPHTKLTSFGLSDVGLTRPNNEDVWVASPELSFYALADGMGGHKAGEIAAKEALDNLTSSLNALSETPPINYPELILFLRGAIEEANQRVYERGREEEALTGMGTTLCCLLWTLDAVIYAHVGDSRIYRFRKDKLELLTRDHSLFARWMSFGKLAEECSTPFPYKNVITRAIGTARKANPEIAVASYEPGDLFFLCSDGLSDVLTENEIEKILSRSETLELAAQRLIEKAKIKGSHDNITVLLVQHPHEEPNLSRQQLDDSPRPEGLAGHADRSQRPPSQPL